MDKQIAAEMTAKGIPVAGWDSLRVVPDLAGIPRVIAARAA
jgi:hypothetical protein